MDSFLGQDLAPNLNNVQTKVVEAAVNKESKKNLIFHYSFLFVYLLIPVLSIEGIVGWSLGVSGAYKTIKLYRSEEDSKNKKSMRRLAIYIAIAVAYNIFMYYAQKIAVAKTV